MSDVARSGEAWTGGQWSVVRACLGAYVVGHALAVLAERTATSPSTSLRATDTWLAFVPSPLWIPGAADALGAVVAGLAAFATAAGAAVAIGARDRVAALVAAYALACLHAGASATSSLALVVVLLLVHAAQPRAPYGSFEARGRVDPAGGWRPNRVAWLALWTAVAAASAHRGVGRLRAGASTVRSALDASLARDDAVADALRALPDAAYTAAAAALVAVAPLALVPRARPLAWLVLAAASALSFATFRHVDDFLASAVVLYATFDPAWVRGTIGGVERVYYDGSCGLCHRAVRFVLAEDADGSRFRVAPLFGASFDAHVGAQRGADLPDSVVVRTDAGRILVRSDAALHVLARLGGTWRVIAVVGRAIPRPLRDAAYDGVARIRKRVFAAPKEACPLLPPHLRRRFEA